MGLTNLNTRPAANAGAWMHVVHFVDRTPLYADDAKRLPVRIRLLGKDSDTYIAGDRAARVKSVENMTKQVKWSAAEQDRSVNETFARCTVAWENIPQGWIDDSDDESSAECHYDNALRLYENPGYKWVREQVDEFISQRANLLKA